jgi:hypothetical protein
MPSAVVIPSNARDLGVCRAPVGFDAEADRQRYFVTESGITVVTRDYSLFENPVTVDYFTPE